MERAATRRRAFWIRWLACPARGRGERRGDRNGQIGSPRLPARASSARGAARPTTMRGLRAKRTQKSFSFSFVHLHEDNNLSASARARPYAGANRPVHRQATGNIHQ
jgi:hypothetical protein